MKYIGSVPPVFYIIENGYNSWYFNEDIKMVYESSVIEYECVKQFIEF